MPCLLGLFKWRKRQKLEKGEPDLSMDNLDRETLLQSWDSTRDRAAQSGGSSSSFEERYVRFGIGGAGNMRKSDSPFIYYGTLINLHAVNVTDKRFMIRVTTYNGRKMETIAR